MIYTFWHYAIANISFLCAEQKSHGYFTKKFFSHSTRSTYYNEKNRIHSSVITAAAFFRGRSADHPPELFDRIYQAEKARTPQLSFRMSVLGQTVKSVTQ